MATTTKVRKLLLAAWLEAVYQQSQEFADTLDPNRTHKNRLANNLDVIASRAKLSHFELTGSFPSVKAGTFQPIKGR